MSDQTYRIETPIPEGKTYTAGEAWLVDWEEGFAIVPDGRLQAIADAPRCEHGMIDEHRHVVGWNPDYNDNFGTVTCQGAPVLRALLDALGRTDD